MAQWISSPEASWERSSFGANRIPEPPLPRNTDRDLGLVTVALIGRFHPADSAPLLFRTLPHSPALNHPPKRVTLSPVLRKRIPIYPVPMLQFRTQQRSTHADPPHVSQAELDLGCR